MAALRTFASETGANRSGSLHGSGEEPTAQIDGVKDNEGRIDVVVLEAAIRAAGGPLQILDDTIFNTV